MKYVLFAILAYIVYQFIFKLVIPVYLATRKIKKGFREMHSRMEEGQSSGFTQGKQNANTAQSSSPESEPKAKAEDYIDFEEVK